MPQVSKLVKYSSSQKFLNETTLTRFSILLETFIRDRKYILKKGKRKEKHEFSNLPSSLRLELSPEPVGLDNSASLIYR